MRRVAADSPWSIPAATDLVNQASTILAREASRIVAIPLGIPIPQPSAVAPDALSTGIDAGRLTDAQGHTVDAQHAIWIMTSNVGTEMLGRSMPSGFRANVKAVGEEMQRERLMERLRETFRPEFLNRVDEVVIFQPLGQEQAKAITRLQMNELGARLLEQGLILKADDSAIELLCKEGFSQTQGARPLRRAIEKLLTVPLSLRILLANIPEHGEVHVSAEEDKLTIDIREPGLDEEVEREEPVEDVGVDAM